MADVSEVKRKKHKKRNKKSNKSMRDESQSSTVENIDNNVSENEKFKSPEPVVIKDENKMAEQKQAPNSNREWSHEQEKALLENVKKFALKLTGRQQHQQRVNWAEVELVDDFSQFEMQVQYKKLTKKVRKTRSALEIVGDAIVHCDFEKNAPNPKKKVKRNPPSAFSIFCKTKRQSLIDKHPELKFVEIHKKLCVRWKELPEEKKGKYMIKAEKAKKEFYMELEKIQEEEISKIKTPLSAFDMWKLERRKEGDLDTEASENDFVVEWDKLSKSTKKGWLQAAASEREKYNMKVTSIQGVSGKKKLDKISKDPASKHKDNMTSDETTQQSSSSISFSSTKRKYNPSEQEKPAAKKSPKKVKTDVSEDDESSSDD